MSTSHSTPRRHPGSSVSRQSPCPQIGTPSGGLEDDNASAASTSPLSSPPASALSTPAFRSPIPFRRGGSQIKDASDFSSISQQAGDDTFSDRTLPHNQTSEPRDGQHRLTHSFNASFGSSSQRIVRDGEVIVTNSDGDTESLSDLETADDLLAQFLKRPILASSPDISSHSHKPGRDTSGVRVASRRQQYPSGRSSAKLNGRDDLPKYQFSLDTLVADAANDKATEAKVAKIKQSLRPKVKPEKPRGVLRHDLLAAAVEDETDTKGIQRLKDAVERTETFATGRSWLFFDETLPEVPRLKFPSGWIHPGLWEVSLKDTSRRGPAFYSGIVANRFSSKPLPNEILLWLMQTIPLEKDGYMRSANVTVLQELSSARISSLITPSDIDQLFQRLGARPAALAVSTSLQPDYHISDEYWNRDNRNLLSVLELIRVLSEKFNDDTLQHTLKIILRLAIDEAAMTDCLVCVEVQNFIVALLENPIAIPDPALHNLSLHLFNTINDIELQNQLLKHILPTSPRLALFRCRLAWAWFYRDPSFLNRPKTQLFDLPGLTKHLKNDPRFDTNIRSSGSNDRFNFWELHALVSILDIAIDSGTARPSFVNKDGQVDRRSEHQFNAAVDDLADCIKAMFSAIRDSGASHLRRSETRERLQALYYRLEYGVRTRLRPAKQWYVRTEGQKKEAEKHPVKVNELFAAQWGAGKGRANGLQ
ncbi:uncharacterized protein BDCG_02304 [Blastomyces dermatitidis ER-3]|uniref:Uncharacterized protein n=2 Tax=Ajellomyces dermatitidis TaxID=5039 RepID=F2TLP4_AJEDA|nr:uncharacterized protein BDCG_02304 [Blastomyces dermatitidis ER-3]EEQ87184.2 hypothetical protein BDCG_02304 [Blastomyces dermatitidis ER-3]EGE84157.2 hypothetical protein BDDG_07102 [Blastomyces dermatitidis ATCC 18188]EQL35265.1 hypothetical protein BDFG_03014 [Blastomyces dermatitidis ATCC 26199]EQL35266.1 hypothetical protein, variant [Blastomyces dermatitidis ATCC 26199]